MNDEILGSELNSSQNQKEKQSPTKKVNLSEFYKRNESLNYKKKQFYLSGEEQKFEEENRTKNYLKTVRYYRPSPIEAPKKSKDIWDEDGNLIQENLQRNKLSTKTDEDKEFKHKKVKSEDFNKFLKRNQGQQNSINKQENNKIIPQNKSDFNSFLKRQEESFKNRTKEHPLPKQKSFINKKSSELAIKASKKTQTKNESAEIEYSFHPDLSKTLNHSVNKLPVELAETQLVLKNIEIESLKLALDAEKTKEPTYLPKKKKNIKIDKKLITNNSNSENLERNNLNSQAKKE